MQKAEKLTSYTNSPGRYHLVTFGCQMNEHDSEQIAGLLASEGYQATDDVQLADIIIINTCSVREKPGEKVFSLLGRLRPIKNENPDVIFGVCGCLAQGLKREIRSRAPYVDLVFGTQNIERLPELLRDVKEKKKPQIEIVEERTTPTERKNFIRTDPLKAWVTVMEGCNNFCAYCMVPYVRGREHSRCSREILTEVLELGTQGIREITLLGQNVNSYGNDLESEISFSELLYSLNNVAGIERIRFVTSHPKDFNEKLIKAMYDLPKVCEQIHLPVQAGANKVLQAMNRGYTRENYLQKAAMLRQMIPNVEISTDIIVAFPGETEEDFEQTLDMLEQVRFDSLFSFIYSDRPVTADKIKAKRIPRHVSSKRFERLWAVQNRIIAEKSKSLVGKEFQVLVEGPSKSDTSLLTGRTRTNRLVHFEGDAAMTGKFVTVEITRAGKHSLRGQLAGVGLRQK